MKDPLELEPDEASGSIGSMLKRVRTEAGLTQKKVGDVLGVSRSYVAMIESGLAAPLPDLSARIEAYIGEIVLSIPGLKELNQQVELIMAVEGVTLEDLRLEGLKRVVEARRSDPEFRVQLQAHLARLHNAASFILEPEQ